MQSNFNINPIILIQYLKKSLMQCLLIYLKVLIAIYVPIGITKYNKVRYNLKR